MHKNRTLVTWITRIYAYFILKESAVIRGIRVTPALTCTHLHLPQVQV
ncbi:MAG: hypothetical protein ABIG63_02020 [Chloroflexota bacterium]